MATKPKSPGTSNRARITVLRRLSSRSVQRIATDRKAPRIAVVGRVGLRLSFIARNRTGWWPGAESRDVEVARRLFFAVRQIAPPLARPTVRTSEPASIATLFLVGGAFACAVQS